MAQNEGVLGQEYSSLQCWTVVAGAVMEEKVTQVRKADEAALVVEMEEEGVTVVFHIHRSEMHSKSGRYCLQVKDGDKAILLQDQVYNEQLLIYIIQTSIVQEKYNTSYISNLKSSVSYVLKAEGNRRNNFSHIIYSTQYFQNLISSYNQMQISELLYIFFVLSFRNLVN